MYRRWKDSNGKDDQYEVRVKQQVAASRVEAEKDGVIVPTTLEDYVIRAPDSSNTKSSLDISNFYEDDDDDFLDDNNDDQGSTDDSVGHNAENDQHQSSPSGNTGGGSSSAGAGPRDKKGGGESFEEVTYL